MAPRNTDYTQDVIARGLQAVRDRRSGQGRTSGSMNDAFSQMLGGSTGYDQFAQARGLTPGNYEVRYGQTDEGKYSGFKNSSDLWNAVEGRASFERDQDRLKAQAMEQLINKRLGYIEDGYQGSMRGLRDTAIDETTPLATVSTEPQMGRTPALQVGQQGWQQNGLTVPAGSYQNAGDVKMVDDGGYQDLFGGGHGGTDSAGILQGQAINKHVADNSGELNKWLAETSDPYLSALETMQQVQQAPITDYEALAGQMYGVDPNIIRGKYDDQATIADFRTQRDMQSLAESGVPYSEAQRALQQAQMQGEDEQAFQQEQVAAQMADEVQGITTVPGDQLAQMADTDLQGVWEAVNSDQFAEWSGKLEDELSKGDQADQGVVDDILGSIQFSDPTLYRIITALYSTGG